MRAFFISPASPRQYQFAMPYAEREFPLRCKGTRDVVECQSELTRHLPIDS